MSPGPSGRPRECAACAAPLADDQRYCLHCGARAGAPRVEPLQALGFVPGPLPADDPVVAPPRRRTPSPRLSGALAAVTLALGVAAGVALGPGPEPSAGAAPQRVVALVVPAPAPAATTATTAHDTAPPAVDESSAATPNPAADDASGSTAATSAATGTTTTKDDDAPAPASTQPADTTPAQTADPLPTATAPAHVWVVSLTGLDATAFAPPSPLADLAAQGAALSGYAAAGPSAAANEIALFGGQVPAADCAAAVAGCVLPAGETSLPDQLAAINLPWRAYVEDPAQRCGSAPSPRVAVSLFTTLATRPGCASTTVGLEALAGDLASADATPALSLVVPAAAHDGSTGLDALSAALHPLVAQITAAEAYKKDGVLLLVADAPPAGSTAPLGALVLSPRAAAGATVAAPTGPVALLRSLDGLLGLDPLGAAAQAPAGALDGVLAPHTTSTP